MTARKWMVLATVLLGSSTLLRAQSNNNAHDDLFAGTEKFAANATSVTEIDQDPDSLDYVSGPNANRARRTILNVVHTYSYDKPGMYNMADVDAFRAKLNTGDWHCSIHERQIKTGESTDVCRKHRTDGMEESAIITVEPKELTFIHTIRRPSTSEKPGGDSRLMPYDLPSLDGLVPPYADAAEMAAMGAEMRAEAKAQRAEIEASRPMLMADAAALRGEVAASLSGLQGQLRGFSLSPDMQRQLRKLRDGMQAPSAPVAPVVPAFPDVPPAPSLQ